MANGADAARRAEVSAILKGGADSVNEFLVTSVMNLNENGCSVGRQHSIDIEELRKHRVSAAGDDRRVAGLSVGKWKLIGTPAIIVSVFLGIAVLQYVHMLNVAETVKQEASEQAASVAKIEVKRENRAIDRDEIAVAIRDEMAAAIAKYIKEHQK